jgi:hypothetical protein
LQWGTASAKSATISLWINASVTGTYYLSVRNGFPTTHSYVFPFSLTANTWSNIKHTVPGPTVGTWNTINNVGVYVGVFAGSGTTFANASVNQAWIAGSFVTTSSTNQGFVSTT